jgi:hypothetical protein
MQWHVRVLAALGVISMGASGCGSYPCAPVERFSDRGTRHEGVDELVWESAPPSGPFAPFDGATTFHFLHGLGVTPTRTEVEVSFTEWPEAKGGGGSSTATGNQATKLLQDERRVVIRNETCANYFVRVVVHASR